MSQSSSFSRSDYIAAVNYSGFFAWAAFEFMMAARLGFSVVPWTAAVSLPLIFGAVWVIGAPIIRRAMRTPLSYAQSAIVGIKISLLVCLLMNLGFRVYGYMFQTDIWVEGVNPGEKIAFELDGRLTSYGWMETLQASALFLGVGMIIGILIRMIVGPGKPAVDTSTAKPAKLAAS